MKDKILKEVGNIVSPVYLVGGCVRDHLLGLTPKDWDLTTPLLPEDIEHQIREAGRRPYLTGKRFGTIGVKIDGQLAEITTFRSETYISGSRKPQVQFVQALESDLSRRDFTINAIAIGQDGIVYDPFNGKMDLECGILRCVGKANERFKEDPLRLLRAARFASQLGFAVDEEAEDMCKQLNYKILEVSKERWVMELDKLLMGKYVAHGLNFLARTEILRYILPELWLQVGFDQDNPHHSMTLWEHTVKVVENTPLGIELRWAALCHDLGKIATKTSNKKGYSNYLKHELVSAEYVLKLAKYLKWSNSRTETVHSLVLNHMVKDSPLKGADDAAKCKDGPLVG